MMKRSATPAFLTAAILLVAIVLPAQGAAPPPEDLWVLEFENDTPQPLVHEDSLGRLTYYWYMVYRVKNPTTDARRGGAKNPTRKPLPTDIEVTLGLRLKKQRTTCRDVRDVVAERHIEEKIVERRLCSAAEMRAEPLKPGQSREGVAIFRIGDRAADFSHMTVSIRGLAARTALGRKGNLQRFRERILRIEYLYVESRWVEGKELKHSGEEWDIKVITLADRTDAGRKAVEDSIKRIDEIIKQIRERRKHGPKPIEKPKTAPKAAAAEPRNGIAGAARGAGRPDPKLLADLRAKADKRRSLRASFTETTGPKTRRHKSTGTIYLRNDKRFAVERTINVAAARALKELRVFDGDVLWVHTTAKELGESVRKWTAARTKKQWRSVEGRPEVDFATVVNPARAWRLFGDGLVRLGVEQLESEVAYVFEIRPGKKFGPLLAGPLSGEVLGRAAGRRVRFWIGADSAFQLRVRVYDARDEVVASLECTGVESGAHLPASRFSFTPPPGIDVTDMNAAIAANDKD